MTDPTISPPVMSRREFADAVHSLVTGLGVAGMDKAADSRPSPIPWLQIPELDALSADGIMHRLINGIPQEAVATGWRADVIGEAERDAMVEVDEDLALEERLIEVGAASRQYGGCWSLLIHDGVRDYRQPLGDSPGRLLQVQPLMGVEAQALAWQPDPRQRGWMKPTVMQVTPTRPGISVPMGPVHVSHMVYMPGLPLSPTIAPPFLGYDMPVPVVYWDAVRDLGLAHRSAALAAMEQSMVVLKLKGGQGPLAGDQRAQMLDALELWGLTRSTRGTSVTLGDDEASRLEAPLSGLDGILRASYDRLTVPEGCSVTWLLGQAPGGLTTDDQASRRQTRRLLERWRRLRANPWLREVYRHARPDLRVAIVWPDVDPPTDSERATMSSTLATRDVALISAGVLSPEEVRERYRGDEELLLPVLVDDGADEFPVAPAPLPTAQADALPAPTPEDRERRYAVPASVAGNAKKAIRWREEHGSAVQGGTETGWRRARQLATEASVSGDDIIDISAWFARHLEYDDPPEDADEPWRDAGRVAGLLWGGASADRWATRARAAMGRR
jgi:hypothetical protein